MLCYSSGLGSIRVGQSGLLWPPSAFTCVSPLPLSLSLLKPLSISLMKNGIKVQTFTGRNLKVVISYNFILGMKKQIEFLLDYESVICSKNSVTKHCDVTNIRLKAFQSQFSAF